MGEATPSKPHLSHGNQVRMECRSRDDQPLFGAIDQRDIAAPTS
ncbi:hypothetical protein [Loktanella sp. DSM 29012]|nr:hypothetical protein [Loktanella sp. DSM 29012]